ncbi:MAG: LUD domain-containing protein [Nocardioides sp.]|uniref:LutC/YkgG family protein n=1 Tax=Nocardioides sp. TaxID=35761 RepID=UPI0039E3E3AD
MSARAEILGRIGAALGDVPRPAPSPFPSPAEWTYGAPATGIEDVAGLFVERVEDYRAVVDRVAAADLPAAVGRALGPARAVVVPPGLEPEWLSTVVDVEVVVDDGTLSAAELDATDAVVTAAAVGIAVTGTIVLDHGADQGRRALSLVPDLHVCVVRLDQLVGDVPEAVARLSEAVASGRPLTWISGPSATSDIELERVEGVHGPRNLHVLLVD